MTTTGNRDPSTPDSTPTKNYVTVPSAAGVAGSTGNGLGWQCGTGQPECVPLEALRLDPALRIGPIKHCQVAHTLNCLSLSLIAVTMCLNS